MPTISIIVPVFNAEKSLHRCINSIIAQTFVDFELLLIDDGSIDRSGIICDEFARKDSRIKVFHQKNSGVSSARNVGIDNAVGDWITFADADDRMNHDALELYMEATHDGLADIIRAGYVKNFYDGTSQVISCDQGFDTSNKAEILIHIERTKYYGFLWNSFFRRDIIGSMHLDNEISWCEDHLFSLRCYYLCKVVRFLPTIAYNYTVNISDSLSFPTDPIMIVDVAEKELQAKMKLFDNVKEVTPETWQIYNNKLFKALSIMPYAGYKVFCNMRLSSESVSQASFHTKNRLLKFVFSPYIPKIIKYAVILLFTSTPKFHLQSQKR